MTATTHSRSGMFTSESSEDSRHKRAHGDEEELEPEGRVSVDEPKFPLQKEKSNACGKGKRQKRATSTNTEEPVTPNARNKRAPTNKVTSPEKSPPSPKKGSFMTRDEAEIVFDMAIEGANWGLITEKLNSNKTGSSVSSPGNLKRHFLTVLRKQALSGYN